MKIYSIRREQFVQRSLDDVFRMFERPEDLSLITPPSMDFILLSPRPIEKKAGTLMDFAVRVFGVRFHWMAMITDYQRPYRFVDVQIKGPYTFWHHTHLFDESEKGTNIVDEVRYVLPFGILGRLLHALLVRRRIERIFDYRAKVIARNFALQSDQAAAPDCAAVGGISR
ncbi:MAG TPA: SRPBCC family protein [Acidobacteriota bacterium]|nr:SRPBCC family protein [Acidobacteriota bacterium]